MAVNFFASFCLGVILFNFVDNVYAAIPAFMLVTVIIFILRRADKSFLKITLYFVCVMLGIFYNRAYNMHTDKAYGNFSELTADCTAVIKSEPNFSENYTSFNAEVSFNNIKVNSYVLLTGADIPRYEYEDKIFISNAEISSVMDENSGTNFSLKDYSSSKKIYLSISAERDNAELISTGSSVLKNFHDFRISVNKRLRRFFDGNILALITGMITGDTDSAKEDFDLLMSGMGISHVVVVSGMHFSIIILLISRFLKWFMVDRKVLAPIALVVSVLLTAFFGFTASVLRSAALVFIYSICDVMNKERHTSVGAMIITLFAMLVYNPAMIHDVSLQLSFGSVAGIAVFYEKIFKTLKRVPTYVAQTVAVSLAANVFTFPVIAYCFGKISLLFVIGNLIITPFVPLIMYGGIIICIVSCVWMKGAELAALPIEYFCRGMLGIMALISDNVKSEIKIIQPDNLWIITYFLGVLFTEEKKPWIKYPAIILITVFLCVSVRINIPDYIAHKYQFNKLNFYDNARTFIVTPEGKSIFIDMSNTVPGKKQIKNNILSIINAKSAGVVDYYIIMGEGQLDLMYKMRNDIAVKNVCCPEFLKDKISAPAEQIIPLSGEYKIKIEDLLLTITPNEDYNIHKVECEVYGHNIGILRNDEDIEDKHRYVFTTVYSYNSLLKKSSSYKDRLIMRKNGVASLEIYPDKVMIN